MTTKEGVRVLDSTTSRRLTGLRTLLSAWGPAEGRRYPWRESDNVYLRLIAEVLLQRTRADAVADLWPDFVRAFPTPDRLANATENAISSAIEPLGLAQKRASYLKRLGQGLTDLGTVPTDIAALSLLPGVGPYSASAFLTSWQGTRTAPVDSNIRRVLGRVALGIGIASEKEAAVLVERLLSRGDATTILHGLLDFGNSPCRPRRPLCDTCPGRSFCVFGQQDRTQLQTDGPARIR